MIETSILIVGTGFSGLGLGAQIKRRGWNDFVLIERADEVGGTWRDNTYPGAACDIQSHLYSFSFRPNPNWSRTYASQPEIFDYLRRTAHEEGLLPHVRFNAELLGADWDPDGQVWNVHTTAASYRARILVTASGHLSDPKLPDIRGIEEFDGAVFHSARWNHRVPLEGARIGVVGTGASSVQIVPEVAPKAHSVTVFQRTPPYVVPRVDEPFSEAQKRMFARVPETAEKLRRHLFWGNEARFPQRRLIPDFVASVSEVARRHRESQVRDPELLEKVTPDYTIGCKRLLLSNDWYPALERDDVHLETSGISHATGNGIVDRRGTEHRFDALVLGTGFEATDLPIAHRLRGREGVLLSDQWARGGQAFACTSVHNFPNLFIMNGPNSGLGAGSVIYVIESQVRYISQALEYFFAEGLSHLEVRQEHEEEFVEDLHRRSQGTVWLSGGCSSWYVDPRSGRLTALWPDMMNRYRAENGTFSPGPYLTHGSGRAGQPVS